MHVWLLPVSVLSFELDRYEALHLPPVFQGQPGIHDAALAIKMQQA